MEQERKEGTGLTAVEGRLHAELEDAALMISLAVINHGSSACNLVAGLFPVFAPEFSVASPEWLDMGAEGQGARAARHPADYLGLSGNGMRSSARAEVPATCLLGSANGQSVVMQLDGDVRHVDLSRSPETGALTLAVLGSAPGVPVILPPAGELHLKILISLQVTDSP